MDTEPQLNLTPYSVLSAVTAVLVILSSDLASSVISRQVQSWCSLFAVIIPAVMAVLFVSSRVRNGVSNFSARLFHK